MDKQLFQDAGRQVLAWTMRHKVAAVIIVLLLLFVLWPKSTPKLRGVEAKAQTPLPTASGGGSAASASTSRPPSTEPVTAQRAADLPLYAPDQDGADPSWSLPAELKADDLQRLARQVDKLGSDIPATAQLEAKCNEGISSLFDGEFVQLFWSRLMSKGFHDTALPLDWYEVVKDRNSLVGNLALAAQMLASQVAQSTIAMRLASIEVRIIGGHVLLGDILFVKASQQYIDQRRPYYERLLPLIASVRQRVGQEFQVELNQRQQQQPR